VEPLTPAELDRLQRRERWVTGVHGVALGAFLIAALGAWRYGDASWFRGLVLWVLGTLVVAAGIVQLMERCPRCGARLNRKLLVVAPEACAACGVPLRPPPDEG
jgi:ribosomal protein L37E